MRARDVLKALTNRFRGPRLDVLAAQKQDLQHSRALPHSGTRVSMCFTFLRVCFKEAHF